MNVVTPYDLEDNPVSEVCQWDDPVYLKVYDDNIADDSYKIEVGNVKSKVLYKVGSSRFSAGNYVKFQIPEDLMTNPYDIIGFISTKVTDSNYTSYWVTSAFRLHMVRRPQPDGTVYANTELGEDVADLMERLEELEDTFTGVADSILTEQEVKSIIESYEYLDEDDVREVVESYGYQDEDDVKEIVESYGYATEEYVTNAIANSGHLTEDDIASDDDVASLISDIWG